MTITITIDSAGRVVIPKGIRERYGLTPGTRVSVSEEAGRLVLEPAVQGPRLLDVHGRLILELGTACATDHRDDRDERLRGLIAYALKP